MANLEGAGAAGGEVSRRDQDIRRQAKQGHTVAWLCKTYGLTRTELKAILSAVPRKAVDKEYERRKAIADLRSEGYSDAAIEAVFGDCPPPTQAEWDNKQEKKSWND